MSDTISRLVVGFVSAVLAVVLVHQSMVWVLTWIGLIKSTPWGLAPVPPFGVPMLINGMFWGGLWGALYGLIHERLPGGVSAIRGLVYGLAILVVSNWLALPFIRGQLLGQKGQVFFAGFDPQRMLAGALILAAFGIGLGVIHALINGAMRARR
jgi:hypothetical protein